MKTPKRRKIARKTDRREAAPPSRSKRRIAILGAGPSALVAAVRLTDDPNWADTREITIYQQGWRVGGKCATGRDLDRSMRVYEHGIHGFLGCYFNALTVMKRVFDELDRPKDHPVPDFEAAFHGMSGVVRYEMDDGRMKKWPIFAPAWWHEDSFKPDEPREPTLSEMVALAPQLARVDVWMKGMVRLAIAALLQGYAKTFRNLQTYAYILKTGKPLAPGGAHPMESDPASGKFDTRIEDGLEVFNARLLDWIMRGGAAAAAQDYNAVAKVFDEAQAWLFAVVSAGGGGTEASRDRLRRLALMLDFFATILRGVVKDRIARRGFDRLDEMDHVAWLRKHGAREETIASPLTSSTPNITYQYPDGDSLQPPVMAAGAYLHWTMMTFTYMGRFIELFEAGSGETLIAPLYDILKKRGVKFAFFHEVTALRLEKGEKTIGAIEVDVQATVKAGPHDYSPYVQVKTAKPGVAPLDAWPDRPLYDQLVEGEALKASGADLESFWGGWEPAEKKVLRRGEDFDDAVLGISVGALPWLTGDLSRRSRRWRRMLEESRTVVTQSMQVWLKKTPWDLGWTGYTNDYDDYLLSANFLTQPNGQGDFTKYITYEQWPEDHRPASLLLLCGTMPFTAKIDRREGSGYPARIKAEVKGSMIQFLQTSGGFMLPGSTVAARRGYGDPFAFDFDLLHPAEPEVKGEEAKGAARFDDQYWRVNINPSDHYVSSPPGGSRWRLPAHDSGFSNLFLAGDWTENGLNVGSMEGSVRSGLLAGEAALGIPREKSEVIGLDPTVP